MGWIHVCIESYVGKLKTQTSLFGESHSVVRRTHANQRKHAFRIPYQCGRCRVAPVEATGPRPRPLALNTDGCLVLLKFRIHYLYIHGYMVLFCVWSNLYG